MKGTIQKKKVKSGKEYLYVFLSYKDPKTSKRKQKIVSTGLLAKGNKRKAEKLIPGLIEEYGYLEVLQDTNDNTNITLCDYLDDWLKHKKRDLRKSTYETYEFRIRTIKAYFEETEPLLKDVTPSMLNTFFKYALNYGKVNQKTHEKEPLSVRSVRSYRAILHAMFNEAIIDGIIDINPVNSVTVKGKKNKEYSEEYLFLTEEEISDLLEFMAEYYPRLLGITFMGAYYGLRRSELLGLKWSSINWKKSTITIEHTVVRIGSIISEDNTKTRSGTRTLNLFHSARACLKKIKKEQEENAAFYGQEYQNSEGYVFTWEDGRPYDHNYISKLFKKATKAYGRPEITLHKLRHSCCSMLINKGWSLKQLQYWMGHSDAETTLNIYSHYNRKMLNESINDLDEISSGAEQLFF